MRLPKHARFSCFTMVLAVTAIAATAQQTNLSYHVVQMPVRTMIEIVLREANIRGMVSPEITGTLSSENISGTPMEILHAIALESDIDVFRFNDTIYVSDANEATTRMILLRGIGYDYAIAGVGQSGLAMDQYPVTRAADGQALAITGPPKYIALVEAVIQSLSMPDAVNDRNRPIVVRRGNNVEIIYLDDLKNTPEPTE